MKKIKYIGTGYFTAVFILAILFYFFGRAHVAWAVDSLQNWGTVGAVAFVIFYVLGTLVFFPVTLLAFCGGVLYGPWGGFWLGLLSSTFGACLAFFLSRYFFREWIQKKMAENKKFRTLEEDVSKSGWKVVALSRVSFVLPYTALNYAFGLTQIPFPAYALSTLIAMTPGTLLYSYLGSAAGSVAAYFQSGKTLTLLEIIFFILTLTASIGLIIYLGSFLRKLKTVH